MPKGDVTDNIGTVEFFGEMVDEFGVRGAMALTAWLVAFGATGGGTHAQMIKRLIRGGFAKSSVYDASAKIRRFQQRLHDKRRLDPSVAEIAEKVSAEIHQKASGIPEGVI